MAEGGGAASPFSSNKRILLSDGGRAEVGRPEEQMVQGTATGRHLCTARWKRCRQAFVLNYDYVGFYIMIGDSLLPV